MELGALDPRVHRTAVGLGLLLLTWVAILLRISLDVPGVLDTDTLNFGLAAFHFDVLALQPHPPGYPGYVMFLKLVHGLAPGLDPVEVAKWGSRLCGGLTVPVAWWTCRQIIPSDRGWKRPMWSAGMAALHPILWFYGADGQSHAAEALFALAFVGAAARIKPTSSLNWRLGFALALGLAGSIRPTISVLLSPLAMWLMWRRPLWQWTATLAVGVAAVAAWYLPLVSASGGWDLYHRAGRAIMGELFLANYSVFGTRASAPIVLANIVLATYGAVLALAPLIAYGRGRSPVHRPLMAVVILSFLFFAMVFTGELGYFSALAALACLVPVSWPSPIPRQLAIRGALVLVGSFGFTAFGPAELRVPNHAPALLPTFTRAANTEMFQEAYGDIVCGASGGEAALLLTDNPTRTHTRALTLRCPHIAVGVRYADLALNPRLDNWLFFTDRQLVSIPTAVPMEVGEPTRARLPWPISRVIVAPDASPDFAAQLRSAARCAPSRYLPDAARADPIDVYPIACLPALSLGGSTVTLTATRDARVH